MCQRCSRQPRLSFSWTGGGRRLTIPRWANGEARRYLEGRRFPDGSAALRFGRQIVWTEIGRRARGYHRGAGETQLNGAEMFEYFPRERQFYERHFTLRRSYGSGLVGRVMDRLSTQDDLWEALYQTYQLWNSDMGDLVYRQHHQPSRARGYLAQLDDAIHAQIMHAMINLTTTSIAPASGARFAWTVAETAKRILWLLDQDHGKADLIVREAQRRGPLPL